MSRGTVAGKRKIDRCLAERIGKYPCQIQKSYTLYVEREKLREQEPLARRAAELINKRANRYEVRFEASQHIDLQDLLSMAAWDIAYDLLKLEITNDAELLAEEIQRIDAGLEGYLQQTGNLPEDD